MIPKDQTEILIKQTYGGMPKTCEKFIEKHRRDAAMTEREIGWDGSTTAKQREVIKREQRKTIEERRRGYGD